MALITHGEILDQAPIGRVTIPKRPLWRHLPRFIQRAMLRRGWIEGTDVSDISDVLLASLYLRYPPEEPGPPIWLED